MVSSTGGDGATISINGVEIATGAGGLESGQAVFVSLRPEKLQVGAGSAGPGIAGTMTTSIFHGDRWLYQVDTPLGEIIVTEPNAGHGTYKRGDEVTLAWSDAAIRVLPREIAP